MSQSLGEALPEAPQRPCEGATASSYRWVILFVAWLSFLFSFIDRLTWANVSVSVGNSIGMPVAALGIFATAFYAGYVACNAVGGIASDKIGGRLMLAVSMLVLGFCTFLFSFTTNLAFGLIVQAIMGLAAGVDYSSCVKLIVTWFDRRSRGTAMGLLLIASSLAVTATNAIVPSLAASIGWQGVYRLLGCVSAIIGVIAYMFLRDNPGQSDAPPRSKVALGALLANRDVILLGLTGFGAFWGTWGFVFWANALMIKGRGFSAVDAGIVVSLIGVAAIVGKPAIGFLSDLTGGRRKWLTVGSLVLFAAMLMVFGTLTDQLAFRIAAPILGLGGFLYSPLMGAMLAEKSGPALAGSIAGILMSVWQLGSVIVPLAVGIVYQWTESFNAAFLTLAAGPIVAVICLLFVKESAPSAQRSF
jgi:sugar phosphate permease